MAHGELPPNCIGSALRGSGANSVRAAPRARRDMFDPLNGNVGPQHRTEDRELRAAQALAGAGRGTDRAMIFDEQEAAMPLLDYAPHVALPAPDIRKSLEPSLERTAFPERIPISGEAGALAMADELFQAGLTEDGAGYRSG